MDAQLSFLFSFFDTNHIFRSLLVVVKEADEMKSLVFLNTLIILPTSRSAIIFYKYLTISLVLMIGSTYYISI
jgi:hypothetical protein